MSSPRMLVNLTGGILFCILLVTTNGRPHIKPVHDKLSGDFLRKLGIRGDEVLQLRQSNEIPTTPGYLVKMYEMLEATSDAYLELGEGERKDLTIHALRTNEWRTHGGVLHSRHRWSEVLDSTVAHVEVVVTKTNCDETHWSSEGGSAPAIRIQLCADVSGCTPEVVVSDVLWGRGEPSYLVLNITEMFAMWSAEDHLHNDTYFNIQLSFTEDREDTQLCSLTDPIVVVHVDPEIWMYETRMDAILEESKHRAVLDQMSSNLGKRMRRRARVELELCGVHSWRVNFHDLGWDSWILRPTDFDASVCGGDCNSDDSNFSGNAFLRMVFKDKVNTAIAARLPLPACAPTKTVPMTLLIQNADESTSVKQLTDMIVEECSCI